MNTKTVHWNGNMLVHDAGEWAWMTAATYYPFGNVYEWHVSKTVDHNNSTRGTSRSPRAARRAIEAAVAKFGYTLSELDD